MTLQELNQLVENADYLRADQRERILKLIPRLSEEDLRQMATVLLQAESTLGEVASKNQENTLRLVQLFTAMNKQAIKQSKKDTYQFIEKDEKSDGNLDQILNQLDND